MDLDRFLLSIKPLASHIPALDFRDLVVDESTCRSILQAHPSLACYSLVSWGRNRWFVLGFREDAAGYMLALNGNPDRCKVD
jgi:hypothetical protein